MWPGLWSGAEASAGSSKLHVNFTVSFACDQATDRIKTQTAIWDTERQGTSRQKTRKYTSLHHLIKSWMTETSLKYLLQHRQPNCLCQCGIRLSHLKDYLCFLSSTFPINRKELGMFSHFSDDSVEKECTNVNLNCLKVSKTTCAPFIFCLSLCFDFSKYFATSKILYLWNWTVCISCQTV